MIASKVCHSEAPPISGLPEIGTLHAKVGVRRRWCGEPGIHNHKPRQKRTIRDYGFRVASLRSTPGMTVFVVLLSLRVSFANAAEPSEADVEQGREIYGEFCGSCHGRDMINPGGVTFDLRKFPKDDFERFRNIVLNGKPPGMPPWREKVSEEDVKLLWDYVRSGG
jgi:cytochrome c5